MCSYFTRFPTLNKQIVQIYIVFFFRFTIINKEPYVFQVKNQKQFSETRGLHYAGMPYLLGGQQFKSDAYLSQNDKYKPKIPNKI